VLGVAHALLAAALLGATFTQAGTRHADRLAVTLVVGEGIHLNLGLFFWSTHPGLTAGALTCVLLGSTVLFAWSMRRVAVLCVAACVAFAVIGAAVRPSAVDPRAFAAALATLAIGAAIAVGSARVLALLRTSLALRQEQLTALSARLMSLQEEERRRLSRELHDEFGQSLTAAMAYLWLVDRQLPEEMTALRKPIAETRRLMSQTLGAMREMAQLLRPSSLDDFGLVPSLEGHLQSFETRHQIGTSFTADGLPERLPADMETALYRIAQEALTNVARHAQARHVRVSLGVQGHTIELEVEDDGVGLPPGAKGDGIGLIGIRERARALRGDVSLTSERGTRLRVRMPLPEETHRIEPTLELDRRFDAA
jgi:signal transduction histidine kinase